MKKYKIIRFYFNINKKNVERKGYGGLTLEEAQNHCSNPKTRKEGVWFDGYTEE